MGEQVGALLDLGTEAEDVVDEDDGDFGGGWAGFV
jgi:hypothetical protein